MWSKIFLQEGDDVYFDCEIEANPRVHEIVWKHNVRKLHFINHHINPMRHQHIQNFIQNHGCWWCSVKAIALVKLRDSPDNFYPRKASVKILTKIGNYIDFQHRLDLIIILYTYDDGIDDYHVDWNYRKGSNSTSIIIQGVFFTGPPPKVLEYGKPRLGEFRCIKDVLNTPNLA